MTRTTPRRDLDPWRLGAVLQEIFAHGLLLAMAWYGGFGYLGLMLILSAELLLICVLSIFILPERGLVRHVGDMIKVSAITAFLLFFVFVTYGVASVGDQGEPMQASMEALEAMDRSVFVYALAYTTLHLVAMAIYARTRPQPRKEWVKLATMQGATTFIALLGLIFLAFILAAGVLEMVSWVSPEIKVDHVLALFAVLLRFAIALLVSRMPEKDLEEIAAKPYVD